MAEIKLSHPWLDPEGNNHEVGERLTLDDDLARRLINGGTALYATKQAAREVGAPEEQAATARK